jgi:ElaB/YqjD/DUF883 family membrane-anchored ribosome-binding protein
MDWQENKPGTSMAGEPGSAGTGAIERGAEVYEKARQTAGEAYEKTSEAVGEAYEKTSKAVTGAYEQAVGYGRENPAMMTLIAFGIGLGVGLLLASSARRPHYGYRSFAEPVVDAISGLARDYLR